MKAVATSLMSLGSRQLPGSSLVRLFVALTTCCVFSSCTQDEAQLSLLVDSFNSQIETKNKELQQARDAEMQVRTQLAEISGRLQEMEARLEESKKNPGITTEAVASAVLEKLGPKLKELADGLASTTREVSTPTPNSGAEGNPSSQRPSNEFVFPETQPKNSTDNVQRFNFTFP